LQDIKKSLGGVEAIKSINRIRKFSASKDADLGKRDKLKNALKGK